MDQICFATAGELVSAYQARDLSPAEVLQQLFERLDRINPAVNAFYAQDREGALSAARASEQRWRNHQPRSALDGVPVSIKDHLSVRGMPVYWGCDLGTEERPAEMDSAVVARLREAGAIVFAKTTMCEMGFYPGSRSLRHGPSRNPWNTSKTAGGSSGGAAAAIASGLGPIAIGSDGGGSIRMPASFTATFGFKPAGGRVPTTPPLGLNPTVGPIARCVKDAADTLSIITRADSRDYFALPADGRDYAVGLSEPGRPRIGALTTMGYGSAPSAAVSTAFQHACAALERTGAVIEALPAPFDSDVFNALAPALLPGYVQRFIDVTAGRTDRLMDSTQGVMRYALGLTVPDLIAANRVLGRSIARFQSLFENVDYLVTPTLTDTAFDAELSFPRDALLSAWGYSFDFACFVPFANFCWLPACSICCGFDAAGMPIGLQIIGRRYDDFGVLKVAAAYEQARGFKIDWPVEPRRA